jgi:hypothetical protein
MTLRMLVAAGIVAMIATTAGAQTQRLRGEIQRVDGTTIFAKARDGTAVTVKLAENGVITAAYKATLADIRAGDYVGSGAIPQPDGSQKALEVHIFAASMRGQGNGHRPWNGAPNSTMTNGAVDSVVSGVDGPVLVVKYKDGDKKIIVAPDTPIVRYEVGNMADLKAGTAFSVVAATKQPDGTFTAPRITVGREGGAPP